MPPKRQSANRRFKNKTKPRTQRKRNGKPKRKPNRPNPRMQARINAYAGNYAVTGPQAKSAVRALALSIIDPHQHPCVRLPTQDLETTAAITVKDRLNFVTITGTLGNLAAGETAVVLFGQPARAFAYTLPTKPAGTYTANFEGTNQTWLILGSLSAATYQVQTSWPLTALSSNVSSAPHGMNLGVGKTKNGNSFAFLNVGDTINVTTTTGGGGTFAGLALFTINYWRGPDSGPLPLAVQSNTITAGSFTAGVMWTATTAGYYNVVLENLQITAGTATNLAIGMTIDCPASANPCWAHRMLRDTSTAAGDPRILTRYRVNACTMLISNTSAEINKQGNVSAARVYSTSVPFYNANATNLESVVGLYTGMAATGVYTYREFRSENELYRTDCTSNDVGTYSTTFDLDDATPYHYMLFGAVSTPNNYIVQVDTTIEFVSESQRYPYGVAVGTLEALHQARRILASNPDWFYENPSHVAKLLGYVNRGARALGNAAIQYGPRALDFMGQVDPARRPVYGATKGLLRQMARLTM